MQPTDIDARVAALLADPATYGLGPDTPVTQFDTHASAVFLAGDTAFKVKRPVRYSYLDYSTLAKREAACRAELEANAPFAGAFSAKKDTGFAEETRDLSETQSIRPIQSDRRMLSTPSIAAWCRSSATAPAPSGWAAGARWWNGRWRCAASTRMPPAATASPARGSLDPAVRR